MTATAQWRGGYVALDTENDKDRAARERFMHQCPVGDCQAWIMRGFVVCGRHWKRLPVAERETLGAAFRVRAQHPDIYQLAVQRTLALLGAS